MSEFRIIFRPQQRAPQEHIMIDADSKEDAIKRFLAERPALVRALIERVVLVPG